MSFHVASDSHNRLKTRVSYEKPIKLQVSVHTANIANLMQTVDTHNAKNRYPHGQRLWVVILRISMYDITGIIPTISGRYFPHFLLCSTKVYNKTQTNKFDI